ncbi:MAG TPA: ligase-associated DNA damage response exonuclease [Nevskiaceae bacterium]|nr:ligase-associated DNA damage response exonuclease [Nevskiaceae bacterium]
MNDCIVPTEQGLYCPAGDFHIDPWRPVPRAVITHAHADHARSGHGHYWCSREGLALTRARIGYGAGITALDWGKPLRFGAAEVSLHPAGHVLGSAQVRVAVDGEVWVVSGDYKRDPDPTCTPFEVVPCDTFITEATFGLPVYRWPDTRDTAREILDWWRECKAQGQTAVLFCYALGKAQRLLAELAALRDESGGPATTETVYLHGAMTPLVKIYREAGIAMLPTEPVGNQPRFFDWRGRLLLAPPGASGTPWMKRFAPYRTGFASGWMAVRGSRRRAAYDRGFVLSDHADWPSLLRTIRETGARRLLPTHGNTEALVLWAREQGLEARPLKTEYEGEQGSASPVEAVEERDSPADGRGGAG